MDRSAPALGRLCALDRLSRSSLTRCAGRDSVGPDTGPSAQRLPLATVQAKTSGESECVTRATPAWAKDRAFDSPWQALLI